MKAHFIYENYHWTPDVVENLPLWQVDMHYNAVMTSIERRFDYNNRLLKEGTKFLNKLFSSIVKNIFKGLRGR